MDVVIRIFNTLLAIQWWSVELGYD